MRFLSLPLCSAAWLVRIASISAPAVPLVLAWPAVSSLANLFFLVSPQSFDPRKLLSFAQQAHCFAALGHRGDLSSQISVRSRFRTERDQLQGCSGVWVAPAKSFPKSSRRSHAQEAWFTGKSSRNSHLAHGIFGVQAGTASTSPHAEECTAATPLDLTILEVSGLDCPPATRAMAETALMKWQAALCQKKVLWSRCIV